MNEYEGPPHGEPAPRDWQPPLAPQSEPPRVLPPQDHETIDRTERAARDVTLAVAAAALLVMIAVLAYLFLR